MPNTAAATRATPVRLPLDSSVEEPSEGGRAPGVPPVPTPIPAGVTVPGIAWALNVPVGATLVPRAAAVETAAPGVPVPAFAGVRVAVA